MMLFEIYGLYEMRFLKLKNSKFMSADFRLRNLNKSLTNIYYHVRYLGNLAHIKTAVMNQIVHQFNQK